MTQRIPTWKSRTQGPNWKLSMAICVGSTLLTEEALALTILIIQGHTRIARSSSGIFDQPHKSQKRAKITDFAT